MIELISNCLLMLRYFFWKIVVQSRGGQLKKGAKIYERIKIYTTKKSPVFIAQDCTFQTGVILAASDTGRIILKKRVYLGEYTMISSKAKITIGENTIIAAQSFVVDFDHRVDLPEISFYDSGYECGEITIGNNVWIGVGCRILKGVSIGDGCVIGAGSVVTKDIPAYSIAVGVPARVIRKRK